MSNIDFSDEPHFYSRQVSETRRFFLKPQNTGGSTIVAGAGFERVKPDYQIDRAKLPFSAVEFVVGGQGTAVLAEREYKLLPGVMFIYDGSKPHCIRTDQRLPLEKYFVDIHPGPGRKLLRANHLPVNQAWLVQEVADVRRLLDVLLHFGTSSQVQKQDICDRLFQAVMHTAVPLPLEIKGKKQKAYQAYLRCCRMIDARAKEIFSVKQLSADCGFDPAYVCRLFRRFDEQTAYDRLVRRRMDLAAARLYGSDVTVKTLAEELGHSDPFNFSRRFKSVFGMPPSQFRHAYARSILR